MFHITGTAIEGGILKAETLELYFGALVPSINEQLVEQGITNLGTDVIDFQRAADAITYLVVHSYITDSEKQKSHRRLFKKIVAAVNSRSHD